MDEDIDDMIAKVIKTMQPIIEGKGHHGQGTGRGVRGFCSLPYFGKFFRVHRGIQNNVGLVVKYEWHIKGWEISNRNKKCKQSNVDELLWER